MSDDTTIEDALTQLAEAKTATDLIAAHQAKARAVKAARRRARETEGPLAATFRAAMEHWDAQKADGISFAERAKGLEKSLRAAWPKGRDTDWKYLCSDCSDYGLIMSDCRGDATCGRTFPHRPHDFGRPCWCPKGARFRDTPKPGPEGFTGVGKSPKKPSGFTKFGR